MSPRPFSPSSSTSPRQITFPYLQSAKHPSAALSLLFSSQPVLTRDPLKKKQYLRKRGKAEQEVAPRRRTVVEEKSEFGFLWR